MHIISWERFNQIVDWHQKWLSDDASSVFKHRGNVIDSVVLLDEFGKRFKGCNFSHFVFSEAILEGSPTFIDCKFDRARFGYCRMRRATFVDCDFNNARLEFADLTGSAFSGCDFKGASIRGAILDDATFQDCTNMPYIPMTCPETGAFVAYKIAYRLNADFSTINPDRWCVIKLEIPEDAKRSSATGRKCRASKAKVLVIESVDGSQSFGFAQSTWDRDFIYKRGETYEIKNFDENRFNECAPGIHFFLGRNEAIEHFGIKAED